jgi:hypothetical protein
VFGGCGFILQAYRLLVVGSVAPGDTDASRVIVSLRIPLRSAARPPAAVAAATPMQSIR